MNYELAGMAAVAQMNAAQRLPGADNCGYGSKILRVTAYMLDKAAVWPGKLPLHNFVLLYLSNLPQSHISWLEVSRHKLVT